MTLVTWAGDWPAPPEIAEPLPTPENPFTEPLQAFFRYYNTRDLRERFVLQIDGEREATVFAEYYPERDLLQTRWAPWAGLTQELGSEGWLLDATFPSSRIYFAHGPGEHPVAGRRSRAEPVLTLAADLRTTADNLTRLDLEVQALDATRFVAPDQREMFELARTGLHWLLGSAKAAANAAELARPGQRRLEHLLRTHLAQAGEGLQLGRRAYGRLVDHGRGTGPTGIVTQQP